MSRRDIALNPLIWRTVGAMFAAFAAGTFAMLFVLPDTDATKMLVCGGLLGAAAVTFLLMKPPEPGSAATHGVLAAVYIGPAMAMYCFAPHGSTAVAAGMFVGPLTAVWLVERWQIAAHLAAATVVLFVPTAIGAADTVTLVTCVTLIPGIWGLGLACVITMEAAERQGERLEEFVLRDPLTGLGNRRLLDERLADEIRRASTSRPLAVVALDLNGFKALNDTVGHAAGDDLLRAVAAVLRRVVRAHDTVVRQGGDEFCLLLRDTGAGRAARVIAELRAELQTIDTFGVGITTGIGTAEFPTDADHPARLLEVADERLLVDKADGAARRAEYGEPILARDFEPSSALAAAAADAALADAALDTRVSRDELAVNRHLWMATGGIFVVFALIGSGLQLWASEICGPYFRFALALGFALGFTMLMSPAPAVGSRANHAVVASTYLAPVAVLLTCQPSGGALAIGGSVFVGPVTALRLTDRRQIAAHFTVAGLLYLSLLPAGFVDIPTWIALLVLVGTMWVLGGCCVMVFEATEAEGQELESLVRRDPLTGVGNRRLLDECLARELAEHAASRAELTVLTLDLNGFKELNDTLGHAAGDDLLREVATQLRRVTCQGDTVVRQGGDEFCVVLPRTTSDEAQSTIAAIRSALQTIGTGATMITTGVGSATYPADSAYGEGLLDCADNRLRAEKYGQPIQRRQATTARRDERASSR